MCGLQFPERDPDADPTPTARRRDPLYGSHQKRSVPQGFDEGDGRHEPTSEPDRRRLDQSDRVDESYPTLKMTQAAYSAVMADLARKSFQREEGGILLGPSDEPELAIRYLKDVKGDSRPASFTIDADYLNGEIARVRDAGLTCVGIVHSHPDGICRPSYGDLEFLQRIFANPKNGGGMFLFPIVCSGSLHPFVVDTRNVRRMLAAQLVLI